MAIEYQKCRKYQDDFYEPYAQRSYRTLTTSRGLLPQNPCIAVGSVQLFFGKHGLSQ